MADYSFKVKYRPGKIINDCDFLYISSLNPRKSAENNWLSVSAVNSNVLEKHLDLSIDYKMKSVNPNLLITEQENDPAISPILNFVKTQNKPIFEQKRKLGRKCLILLNY